MEHFLKTRDYLVSGEEFNLKYDPERELLITYPQPDSLSSYYASEQYISHTDSNKGMLAWLYQLVKKYSIKSKLKLINRMSIGTKSLLDIGAGTGDLLLAAKRSGYQVEGVEPNVHARARAQEKGVTLKSSIPTDRKYQVITLWHVLEHLPAPDQEIEKIRTALEKEGTVLIAVPNFKSFDAEFYGTHWAAYDVPRHLWHFSKKAISDLFQRHQMKVIDVRPMPFDAFYIALLSEKYKHGKNRWWHAFYIGLRSNWKARKTGEYSSLLYIIKKTS